MVPLASITIRNDFSTLINDMHGINSDDARRGAAAR